MHAPSGYPGAPGGPTVMQIPFNGDINVGGQASDFGQQVHDYIVKFVGEQKCPSVSVSIVKGDYPAFAAAYNWADETKKIPATPATCYRIGSLSKVFTATCLMQLVEQGRLSLHDPVQKYIPYFLPKGVMNGADVTVCHLLSHYAGLPHTFPLSGEFETIETLVRKTRNMSQQHPTGHQHSYSNAGLTVAGHLVEIISGKPFVQYAHDYLFEPLEMHYSTFNNWNPPKHIAERMAIGHNNQKIFHQPPIYGTPAGGMISTVLDISNFITMVINKGQFRGRTILRPETIDQMTTIQNEHCCRARPNLNPPWGLGWSLQRGGFGGQKVVRHNGATQSFASNCIILPEKRMGLIMITNCRTEAWKLPQLSVKVLQLAIHFTPPAPKGQAREAPEAGEESADVDE